MGSDAGGTLHGCDPLQLLVNKQQAAHNAITARSGLWYAPCRRAESASGVESKRSTLGLQGPHHACCHCGHKSAPGSAGGSPMP